MKKIFSCIAAVFFIMAACINTYAYGLKIEDGEAELIEDMDDEDEIQYDIEAAEVDAGVPAAVDLEDEWEPDDSDSKEYYYDQLSDLQKYIYDYLNENADSILTSSNPIYVKLPSSLYYSVSDYSIYEIYYPVILYFDFDHAEKFGYNFTTFSCSYLYIGDTIIGVNLRLGGTKASTPVFAYDSYDDVVTDQGIMETNVQAVLDTIPDNASRYKKLQIINDWLVDNNTYNYYVHIKDEDSASKIAWMSSSALIYGNGEEIDKHPACEGYAEAFKYLCDRVDIPCVSIRNSDHKWNLVQMEDGNWYNVDVTWDDPYGLTSQTQIEAYRYRYFLLGDTTLTARDQSSAHSLTTYNMTTYYNVEAPETSDTDYVYAHNGDINGDYLIDGEDAAIMLKYISGITTLTDEEITLGDIDNDGDITLMDAVLTLKTMQ